MSAVAASLLASDPALSRLRMASRVTLTLIAVGLSLVALHSVLPLPVAAYGVAIVTAMQGALAIRDTSIGARAVTRAIAGAAGFVSVAAASVLSSVPLASELVFLALVFAAVYARKYGVRWNAVGMFAFMCFFMGSYMHPATADLPGVALAILLSGLVSHAIRNLVLPERRADDFRRAVLAIGQRVQEMERAILAGDSAGWPPDLRRHAIGLQEKLTQTVLVAEGYLPLGAIDDSPERQVMGELAVLLFDLHLASETAVMASLHDAEAPKPERLPDGKSAGETPAALARLRSALSAMRRNAAGIADTAFEGALATAPATPSTAGRTWLEDPALRLAIQVTLASAIAMSGGLLLSKTRWFWATLTAFLVFTNTQSRGDTMLRAVNRAGGTVAGIVVGIALATLLNGEFAPSIALAIVFVFAGFYLLQISYAAMTFFVTIVISLLYGLLGQFTPELLVLRLEETLIGAAAGAFIAFAVFPRSTSAVASGAAAAFFDALDELLVAATARAEGRTAPSLVPLSRRLDQLYADLAIAAHPLGSNWQVVQKPGRVRQTLLRFMGLAHWSRRLARSLQMSGIQQERPPADLVAAIAALRVQIAEAKAAGADIFSGEPLQTAGARRPEPRRTDFTARAGDPHFAVDVLSHILDRAMHGGERIDRLATGAAVKPAGAEA